MNKAMILFCLFVFPISVSGQGNFQFERGKNKAVIDFQLINNLIILPITVNGVELNFLLDSGIEETILFSLDDTGEISFENVATIRLRGLGSEQYIEGYKSMGNSLTFSGLTDRNHDVYIVLDQEFNFSSYIGIPVNGIIGHQFFKNNLVEINYDRKRITIYKDERRIRRKLENKFTSIPIQVQLKKPYLQTEIIQDEIPIPAKLLIDTGSSDAIWLFDDRSDAIRVPSENFEDYLGRGFSGEIHGRRGRINKFTINGYEFSQPIVAFPDSASLTNLKLVDNRLGSVGGEILRRFTIIFDYRNSEIFLKKGVAFSQPFNYNMSGIELQHDGVQWVKETVQLKTLNTSSSYDINGEKLDDFKFKFELKPVYCIASVRADSPAELSGLKKGDVIVSINGIKSFRYTLQEISSLLKSEDGKIISIIIERDSQEMEFEFQLKSIL